MKKTNRVYAVVGIGCKMSMWNADMSMSAKRLTDGTIFGSDKALKFAIKDLWNKQGEKILVAKHRNNEYKLLNLKEIYNMEFGEDLPSKKDKDGLNKVLKNILKCLDVRNFGTTFAVADINLGITGVVQIGQGLNKWEPATTEIIDILSPYVNPKKDGDMTSIGSKTVVDEAHYFYPLTVNPANYNDLIGVVDNYEGYTEEDYLKLKDALLVCATALETNSKTGCENEFALFIECKDGSNLYLANLDSYIKMTGEDKTRIVDITKLQDLLNTKKEEIKSIEVYYNPYKLQLNYDKNENIVVKNMFGDKI